MRESVSGTAGRRTEATALLALLSAAL